jgi:hypothetical protein
MSKIVRTLRPTVATFAGLPLVGNVQGDVRVVRATGIAYYWAIVAAAGALADWKILNDPIPSAITDREKLNLELEMEFKAAEIARYKELSYVGKDLTGIDIYVDNTKTVQLFSKVLTYVGKNLTKTVLTRTSDGATLTKDFVYAGKDLTSVTVS